MPLEPPAALASAQITFHMADSQSTTRNPFTHSSEDFDWQREIWRAEVRFSRRQAAEAADVRGFLAKLRGRRESFYLGDPAAKTPQGTQAADFVLATGASPGDRQLAVTMGAGATLKSGDYLQLGDRLHVMTDDATADGAGAATLNIWPAVRDTQSPGATVKSTGARGSWKLETPRRSYTVQGVGFYTTTLALVEDI